jgi:hypothetical protein
MAITVSNARCVERALKALAEKPKREQLQQNDEKRDQDDKQCELSQVHGKRCARREARRRSQPYRQSADNSLAITSNALNLGCCSCFAA